MSEPERMDECARERDESADGSGVRDWKCRGMRAASRWIRKA